MSFEFKAAIDSETGSLLFTRKGVEPELSVAVLSKSGQQLTQVISAVDFIHVIKSLFPDLSIQ